MTMDAERTDINRDRWQAVDAMADTMAELALRTFRWQTGTRGLTDRAAMTETMAEFDDMVSAMREVVHHRITTSPMHTAIDQMMDAINAAAEPISAFAVDALLWQVEVRGLTDRAAKAEVMDHIDRALDGVRLGVDEGLTKFMTERRRDGTAVR